VLEQQGVHRRFDEVVDRDDLNVRRPLQERLERLAADPPEPVDADACCHRPLLRQMQAPPWAPG